MTGAEKFLGLLTTLLTRRDRDLAPTRTARVLGRHADGTERVLRTDARCVTRAAPDNHYAGTVVLNPSLAAFHRAGTAGLGTSTTIPAPTLWIERLEPSEFHPGQTLQVTVHGRGFDETVRIAFLDPDPAAPEGTLNPDLEVLAVLAVSSSTAKVAATETALHFATLWIDNVNFEVADAAGARFLFDGSAAEAQDGAGIGLAQGFAAADGTSIGLSVPSNTLRALPPILGAATDPRWPTTGAWVLAPGFGSAFNAALTADGATALLYGLSPDTNDPIVLEAPTTATAGEPTARVSISPHPVHGIPPSLLFFLE